MHVHVLKTHTVELQWLKHLWNHENMFETGAVRANESQSWHQVRTHTTDVFPILFILKVYCVFSLESPHGGDSNEYIQHKNNDNTSKLSQAA